MADGTKQPVSPKPVIFISYSHKDEPEDAPDDEKWLSYVQHHLSPAVKSGIFDLWVDEDMPGGDKWKATIAAKLNACDICILLVSPNSLASDYVIDVEVKTIKERQKQGDVPLFPIVLKPFATKTVPWLMDFNLRPPNGESLWDFPKKQREKKMVAIVNEIVEIVDKIAEKKKAAIAASPQIRLGEIKADLGKIRVESYISFGTLETERAVLERLEADLEEAAPQLAPSVTIDTIHLPETPYERLVGRDAELKRLDEAWTNPAINVFSLVAEGGAGKSALVNEWLTRMQAASYRGSDAVLGWSFYSQGSKERATSADQFLNWALEKLGIKLETTSASAKAEAIAEALAKRHVLLLLDGVEPLQHGPGPQTGQLKDLGLRALLRRFAAVPPGEPHGLIVITSRLAVADIARWKDSAAPVLDVEKLSDEAGAALLRDNGVWGTDKELKAAAHDFGGHPLALGLLASFLKETQFGDVRRRDHIREFFAGPDNPHHDHARRVMESYENEWLTCQPELLAIMHMVGLFDRPASADCLKALRKKPTIQGLTDAIVGTKWRRAVARLRELRLLSPQDRSARDALDAHPLVREWFGESLRKKNETAWREAHSRLYEHLRDTTKEGKEPTLKQLEPLYQAIAHGCRAGRHQETLSLIYYERICRQVVYFMEYHMKFYSMDKLGEFGSDLAAISWFFDEPYKTPVATLGPSDRLWVLGTAASCLRAQGRLAEARVPMCMALARQQVFADLTNAAILAENLSGTELMLGEIPSAVATAERAIAFAERSDPPRMVDARKAHAYALHVAGLREEAEAVFADAERWERKLKPDAPLLYSPSEYEYCDLLLAKSDWPAARTAAQMVRQFCSSHLTRALNELTMGRAHLGLALTIGEQSASPAQKRDYTRTARACLDEAVDGLRASGHNVYIPRGLLARAAFWRSVGDWPRAKRDLDEVEEIAEPGPMKLYLCDLAIERARLAFAEIKAFAPLNGLLKTDNPPKPSALKADERARLKSEAAEELKTAADHIATCGYHRRDEELAELRKVLAGSHRCADLPPRV